MYSEHLDLTTLCDLLTTKQIGRAPQPNEVWESVDSTNTRALELAKEGGAHGVIVAARQQTHGRGRQERTWVSPLDAGLYISFLLRPQVAITHLPLISLATGTAVVRAVQATCGIALGLKWVNDVVIAGKKLGGILAEMPERNTLVIGIGLNLMAVARPPEIKDIATSIEEVLAQPVDVNSLAAAVAAEVERAYSLLCAQERTQIINEWKRHTVTLGKQVRATIGNETIEGLARDIDVDGSLILSTAGGDRHLHAGEISIRTADGNYA